MTTTSVPRVAIIGCGAFTEVFYLPAFACHPDALRQLILVDTNAARLEQLAAKFEVPKANLRTDYTQIVNEVDGAIVAVPHQLHYKITMDFLGRGKHVLCEKPLAESPEEAHEMVAQADKSGVTLSANHVQRLFPANIKVKELLAQGKLGKPLFIRYHWGAEFTWPTASGFYFSGKAAKRGGVLLDRGPHALDLVCWWLGAKPEVTLSENDSFGGPEAVAQVKLWYGECEVDIKLSWLSDLSNSYTVRGELAEIENPYQGWWQVPIRYASGESEVIPLESTEQEYDDFGRKVVGNFMDILGKGAAPLIPAREVIPSVELLRECYAKATRFKLPWYENVELPHVN